MVVKYILIRYHIHNINEQPRPPYRLTPNSAYSVTFIARPTWASFLPTLTLVCYGTSSFGHRLHKDCVSNIVKVATTTTNLAVARLIRFKWRNHETHTVVTTAGGLNCLTTGSIPIYALEETYDAVSWHNCQSLSSYTRDSKRHATLQHFMW